MAKTAYKKPKVKIKAFDVINYVVFILLGLIILVPIWKVLVDSLNSVGVYQFKFWPDSEHFTLLGYKTIIETQALYRPFVNSVVTLQFQKISFLQCLRQLLISSAEHPFLQ